MDLVNIAQGWFNYATSSNKELVKERLAICDTCPFKQQLTTLGKLVVTTVNQQGNVFKCEVCGCPLAAKTTNKKEECPKGKWKKVEEESFY
jgi:hypothetical protein